MHTYPKRQLNLCDKTFMDIQIVLSSVITLFIPFNIFIVVILIKSKIKIYVDSNLSGERFYLVLLNFFSALFWLLLILKGSGVQIRFYAVFNGFVVEWRRLKLEFEMRGYFKSEFWLKFSISFFLSKFSLSSNFVV